ncbi:MFS general substrate transporter, partial [Piedraia hortae CBS 480.64]
QVPLIVVAGGVGVWVVDVPTRTSSVPKLQRVDFLGAITLVTSLVLFLFGLNSGGNTLPWTHPLVPTSLILGGFTLLAFVYVESRAAEPILPPRLLTHRTILSSCLANWFVSMSVYILIYYTPIYTHVVLDFTPTASGGLFIPQAAGSAFGSLAAGLIMKASGRYRLLNLASQTLNLAACAAILATFTSTVPTPLPFIFLFIMGVGYGATLTVTLIAMISATEHRNQAVVTSASYAFRSTGASVGICLAGAVFQNLVWGLLVERFGEGELREGVRLAFVGALRGVWAVALGLAAAGAGVSLGIGEHVLFGDLERRDT